MTVSTLRPSGTTSNTGSVTGAASAHAALSDDSDSSYVTLDQNETAELVLEDLSLPAGAIVKSIRVRARTDKGVFGTPIFTVNLDDLPADYAALAVVTWTSPITHSFNLLTSAELTDAGIDAASPRISNVSGSSLRVYELFVDVTYVERPVCTVHEVGS